MRGAPGLARHPGLSPPPLTGVKAADLPVAARQSFEIACGLLADDTSSVERSPGWLPRSVRTCARTPAAGQGISEVVVLTAEHHLVEIRVLQLDLDDIDRLREGLAGRLVVGGLGFVVGAAAVVGGSLAFAEPEPRGAVSVSSSFCADLLAGPADTWGLTVLPQETVTGDRDELTACEAASPSGDVRLTLTVLALAEETAAPTTSAPRPCSSSPAPPSNPVPPRTTAATAPWMPPTGSSATPARSSPVTGERMVTVVFTAPPGRAVAALAQVLSTTVAG